jgi:hypothetical protein
MRISVLWTRRVLRAVLAAIQAFWLPGDFDGFGRERPYE